MLVVIALQQQVLALRILRLFACKGRHHCRELITRIAVAFLWRTESRHLEVVL